MILTGYNCGLWTTPFRHGKPVDRPVRSFDTETREAVLLNDDGSEETIIDHNLRLKIWHKSNFERGFPAEFEELINSSVFIGFTEDCE